MKIHIQFYYLYTGALLLKIRSVVLEILQIYKQVNLNPGYNKTTPFNYGTNTVDEKKNLLFQTKVG